MSGSLTWRMDQDLVSGSLLLSLRRGWGNTFLSLPLLLDSQHATRKGSVGVGVRQMVPAGHPNLYTLFRALNSLVSEHPSCQSTTLGGIQQGGGLEGQSYITGVDCCCYRKNRKTLEGTTQSQIWALKTFFESLAESIKVRKSFWL